MAGVPILSIITFVPLLGALAILGLRADDHTARMIALVTTLVDFALSLLLWAYFAGRLLTAAIAANAALWKRRMAKTTSVPEESPDSQGT